MEYHPKSFKFSCFPEAKSDPQKRPIFSPLLCTSTNFEFLATRGDTVSRQILAASGGGLAKKSDTSRGLPGNLADVRERDYATVPIYFSDTEFATHSPLAPSIRRDRQLDFSLAVPSTRLSRPLLFFPTSVFALFFILPVHGDSFHGEADGFRNSPGRLDLSAPFVRSTGEGERRRP